jgi:hypothetical protein
VLRVLASLGRVDVLRRSLGRFAERVRVTEAHRPGELQAGAVRQLGPDRGFGRLWQTVGLQSRLTDLLGERRVEPGSRQSQFDRALDL